MRLTYDDYNRKCVALAKFLIGKTLVRRTVDDSLLKARIIETEAYPGGNDRASYSYNGRRTEYNNSMYEKPGTLFVHKIRSMCCFGVSSKGDGAAILIRAVEPLEGKGQMTKIRQANKRNTIKEIDLCNGPAKLCQAMSITMSLNGKDSVDSDELWIEHSQDEIDITIKKSKRIGIGNKGEEAIAKLWRFYEENNYLVSHFKA